MNTKDQDVKTPQAPLNVSSLSPAEKEALLARARAARLSRPGSRQNEPIPRRASPGEPVPLSFAQQRLWFIAQTAQAASEAYHLGTALMLTGALDEAALQAALDRLVARHESLRTCIESVDGGLRQRIGAPFAVALRREALGGETGPQALARCAQAEASEPFDLARGPLVRGRLLTLDARRHVLLLSLHHIVADGWSVGVLHGELARLYEAYAVEGVPPEVDPLPPVALQYADYSEWQRGWLAGPAQQAQLAHWTEALAGAPALSTLPGDRPRPAVQDYRGDSVPFELDRELAAALKALSQRHGTTLYMTLLAGWAALVSRLSGQDDLVIGSPVANRPRVELEPVVGLFVNTVAVRLDFGGRPDVAGLLSQVRERVLQAQSHADLPFEQVVEALQPQRSLSHAPVFQLMFALQNTPPAASGPAGLQFSELELGQRGAKFDLTLDMQERDGRVLGRLGYAEALYDRAGVERHLVLFKRLLRGLAADDARPVDRIDLLDEAERRQLVVDWNDTRSDLRQDVCVHRLVEQRAQSTPQAVALECDGQALSYRALNERANRVAHRLVALGVRPDTPVAVLLERGIEMVVCWLAVLKAGAAYVPVDPAHPAGRLAFLLGDSEAPVVLTHSALRARLPQQRATTLEIDGTDWQDELASNLQVVGLKPSHLAYVVYTSGSTGEPKGVMVEHRQLANLVGWHVQRFGLKEGERTSSTAGVGFDACTWEVWPALCSGATLAMAPARVAGDPLKLLDWWQQQALHTSFLVTALAELALQRGMVKPPLRALLTGGDRLTAVPEGLQVELVNNYGPTETTVVATSGTVHEDDAVLHIGRPIANTRVYLLDRHGQPVPLGAAGELHIGGAQVARGYLNRPALTQERFFDDPFAGEAGARMYRTGDLARWREDGTLEFLGRNDAQLKIRGFRIEPGEIEAKLRQCEGVRDAAVLARDLDPGEKALVAYVAGEGLAVDALRDALSRSLPGYMVPAAIVVMAALPLTPNGKLDRRALPAPDAGALARRAHEAPQGDVELALAQVWRELLRVDAPSRHDDFFQLGGHSLLAVQLMDALRRRGLQADIQMLFAQPTLAGLAAAMRRDAMPLQAPVPANGIGPGATSITPAMLPLVALTQAQVDRIVEQVPGGAANVQDIYPLAPLQEGILFHHLLQTEADPYLSSATLAFDTRERLEAFVAALQQVIARHDVLRTAVLWEGLPEPVQVVWRHAPLSLERPDLPPGDAAGQLAALAHGRIDLRRAPLVRAVAAADAGGRRWLLQLVLHHLAIDHTTLDQVFHEMALVRDGRAADLAAPLPFREAVGLARQPGRREAHERFFRELLGDVGEPTAPYGLRDVQGDGSRVAELQVRLDPALARRLRAQARGLGVSVASLFHWAWAELLGHAAHRDDVVFGTVVSGRLQGGDGAARALGLFINTLPLRVRLAGQGARDGVRQVHALLLRLLAHEHAPLSLAQRCSALPASVPLFSALLNFRHSDGRDGEGVPGWPEGVEVLAERERTNFPFGLSVDDLGEDFLLTLQVAQPVEVATVMSRQLQLLQALAAALEGEGAPATPAAIELPEAAGCLHERFERQAAATPEAVALRFEDRQLTYRELNAEANRLARHLRRHGAAPDRLVALCMPRGLEMVVGLVAILKSGAGYVPMDPAYPPQRLAHMLQDSAPVLVLAQGTAPAGGTAPVLDLVADRAAWAGEDDTDLAPAETGLAPHHLAYVIYTSGSTGQPKGVMVEHRNVTRLFTATEAWFGFGPGDVWTLFHSHAFDFSVWELWGALLHGGRGVVVPQAVARSPEDFYRLVCREGVTVLNQTPSAFRQFMAAQAASGEAHGLRHIVFGGEALPAAMLAPWYARNGGRTRLANMYGITETTVHVTWRPLEPMDALRGGSPIGEPIPDLRLLLLDAQGRPVAPGEVGEIHVGGAGVARGYLNRPELTAQRFIADPAGGGRLYRSGDLARRLHDGSLEFIGRNDSQVKVRGFRIELGEIEARLQALPAVREAVVLAQGEGGGDAMDDRRLVAWVVARDPGAALDVAALREGLRSDLPDHMLPAHFVAIDRVPLTVHGKLDAAALPAPVAGSGAAGYVAPRTPAEACLAAIWAEVLQVPQVGIHDDFFALGGDSMRTIAIVSQARERGLALSIEQIFRHQTVSAIAAALAPAAPVQPQALRPQALAPADREKLPEDVEDAYGLTQLQLGMLFHNRMSDDGSVYHDVFSHHLRVQGGLSLPRLQAALDQQVRRHPVLRTRFDLQSYSVPLQLVHRTARVPLQVHDLSALDEAAQQRFLADWVQRERCRGFGAGEASMLRVFVHPRGGDDLQLTLSFHHAILDGWSVAAFVTGWFQAYERLGAGDAAEPAPLASRFGDAVAAEQRVLQSDEARSFWDGYLADHTLTTLPPRDAADGGERTEAIALDPEVVAGLDALARRLHLPLRTLLLAAHLRAMAVYGGGLDVTTGMVSHTRPSERDGDQVLGLFLNTLPLRVVLQDGSWEELALQTFQSELAVLPWRHYPYARIMQDHGRRPLFETSFNYVHFHVYDGLRALPSLQFLDGIAFEATNHALAFHAALQGGALALSLQRDPSRLSAGQLRRIAAAHREALTAMARAPASAWAQQDLLAPSERAQVLQDWNATRREYQSDRCLHQLIEAQAKATPQAVAVQDEREALTYAELNGRANRLAHHLRSLGVGPDVLVAVCLERGCTLVVALLAVLKAGGAYVPLEPGLPAKRLQAMLADSAPRVVLTAKGVMAELPASALVLDEDLSWREQPASDPVVPGLTQDALAYVIYTSGSTGEPKGVMNGHRGIVNRLLWMQEAYRLQADDAVLQKTPCGFDVSVWEFFWPLLAGAKLVMARPEGHKDPQYLGEAIEREGITTLHFVPSMLQAFVDSGAWRQASGLRRVVCSGEALPGALARRVRELLPQAQLHNLYGPTEAAVDVTAWACEGGPELPDNIPIGRPIANTRIYVLDRHGQPVPVGVAGEIHIAGVQVARGYLNKPELTKERFVADPYATEAGARMYKTGDLGRWRADGAIEYLGRNDHQVKLRGQRIELGEIEAQLLKQPGVKEAVVVARTDAGQEPRLVAYLVPREAGLQPLALREALAAVLPEHMLPAAWVMLEHLPLSANGKLDRKALPIPDAQAVPRRPHEAPEGEVETVLATIWGDLLGLDRIGRHDHFFELGGHSLLAVQLMERMRQRELYADIRSLFSAPTLSAFAAAAEAAREAGWRDVAVPPNGIPTGATRIVPAMLTLLELDPAQVDRIVEQVPGGAANVQDIYPLAPLQEGILFHHLLQTRGDPYLLSATLAFDAREGLDAFVDALQQVIARHDALRTAIQWEGLAEPVQVVWREARIAIEAPVLEGDDIAAALRRHADPRQRRIDLRQAPLMRGFEARDPASGRWLLQLLMHHIVTDHTTLDVMFEDMALLRDGRGAELPPAVPFRNFVAQARGGVSTQEHEAFFRAMLADVEEPSAPFGMTDMRGDGANVDEARITLDPALSRRLRTQARRLGVSPSALFHLGWAQVLARISGRDDVVFGTALFGRMHGGVASDRALGLFMNTLPLRLQLDDTPVEQAVRDTHARLAALLRHEHAPLSLAQRCSGVPSALPLFAAGFNYRHSPDTAAPWPGMEVLHGEELSNFPAVVKIDDRGEDFLVTADTQRPVAPMRLCRYMETVLQHLAEALDQAPGTPVHALQILPADELDPLLHRWNAQTVPVDRSLCVHQLFERQAAATPGATALVCGGERLSYAALNARANRLAHELVALGVRPDGRVAIALPRGIDQVVAVLATLKAGGAYVPLDPAYPPERLAFMLDDSRPRLVLTTSALQAQLPASRALLLAQVLELDDPQAPWQSRPDTDPDARALGLAPQHLAYLIYTSGSTGRPKGVMVEHAGLVSLAAAQVDSFALREGSRVLQFASFSFDGWVFELVLALCHGASLHLVPGSVPLAGDDLLQVLDRDAITHLIVPPAVLASLPEDARMDSVRTLVLAGEAVSAALVQRWGPGRLLINGYGPTETTVCGSLHPCDPAEAGDPPIGLPLPNKRIHLLDPRGRPVPVGVAGEIHIGGDGIARGYLNRPELTAAHFVDDPFVPGARLYRSGDLARRRDDGRLVFAGRRDRQVKLRGFRIELGEIEARLLQAPGVREAAVLVREDEPGLKRLVAYCAGEEADATTPQALRAHLAAVLPEHMVPAAYVRLEALPLTPNGKLDRRALPAPEDAAFGAARHEPPQGELETALAALWRELLEVERIGRHDHFFELGGHSLVAVQLISRLRQRLGIEMALSALFAHPVLHEFAALAAAAAPQADAAPLAAGPRPDELPVSFAQQRLWFIAQLGDEASAAYHMSGGLRLAGRLDEAALGATLDRLLQRHEVLRTRFERVDGRLLQRIAPAARFPLVRHDLSAATDAPAGIAHWRRIEEQTPFDLGAWPLIRGRLLRLGADEHVLLLTLHHIVADGWSMGVLARELGALYEAYALQGVPPHRDPLPPLPLQYADYALWQRRWLEGERLQQQLAYWQAQLGGAPVLATLPTDRPRPALQQYAGRSLGFALDAALTARLKALSQRHGCTLFMTLLAAWGALCGRLAGQDDIVIGSPVANRGRAELEPLVGCFVNTLALRLDLSGAPDAGGLLARVRETVLQAQQHQDVPFEQVVEALKPERTLAHSPVFQLMFAWQNLPASALQLPGLALESLPEQGDRATQFDLSLTLQESGEGIAGTLEYASALFDRSTVERHLAYLRSLLQGLVRDETQPVDAIELMDAAQRRQVLVDWNDTGRAWPQHLCIHELFEQQVRAAPDAIALEHEGLAIGYAELNRRANRLAHYLRDLGVGPDERVALQLRRTPALLVAILATLKAGGAYVPLDPACPPERLAAMLADSTPMAFLTQSELLDGLSLPPELAVLQMDDDTPPWDDFADCDLDPPLLGLTPRHLAYVIYTSGSTGLPKGVMIEHRSLCNQVAALQQRYGLDAGDRVLQFAAPSFDMSVEEIFGALASGATLVLATPDWVTDAARWSALAEEHRISVANLPTLFWQHLAQAARVALPPTLRLVSIGGEAVGAGALAAWWARSGHRPALFNAYGPTEATVNASILACTPQANPRSIGRPLANTRLYLLDPRGQPAPVGVPGELYIGGAGVARGYLNRERLTQERFVDDPFVETSGARLYRTGDLGRWLPDGTVEFLGRNDHQVKIRGFRIELGEIEARLVQQPGVREACVLAREHGAGERRLVAWVAGDGLDAAALRQGLLQALPEYMLPAAFVLLPALPLTPNGKLDRRALPAPDEDAFVHRVHEAPQGPVETLLAQAWAELLQVEQVGRQDHFFELGGHSLLAVQLLERLRAAGLAVDIRDLFSHPTLQGLAAAVVRDAQPGGPLVAVPPNGIPPGSTRIAPAMLTLVALESVHIERIVAQVPGGAGNVQDIYPLAPLQEGILFHHLLQAEGDPYLSSATLAFDTRERLDGFVAALQQVIDRHEVLRTAVLWEGLPEPVQVVWWHAPLHVEVLDDAPAGDVAAHLQAWGDPGRRRIDVRRAPMLQALAAHDPAHGRWLLQLLEHHLVTDHTTLDVLFGEVALIQAGRAAELPEPVPFRNFVAQARLGLGRQEHERFFRAMLGDVVSPTAPFGRLDVQGDGSAVAEAQCLLPDGLSRRLRRQARALGVSAASLFHWAWAQVLARTTGQDDVVFGTVLFGRLQGGEGSARAMGLFINTLPLRVTLGGAGVADSLRRVHDTLLQLLRHEHAPLSLAQRCSGLPSSTPLFSTLLNYRHDAPAAGEAPPSLPGLTLLAAHERTNYPFALSVDDLGEGFALSAQVARPIAPQRVCGWMSKALHGLVEALERAPQSPAHAVDILLDDEIDSLARWNDTRRAFRQDLCVHQAFELQADATPGAVALEQGTRRLSYRALDEAANRLAHRLRELGLQPDDRVALCLPRCPELVVGLLATLKAGAAYVPLDPAHPPQRLSGLLEDAAPRLLLTQRGLGEALSLPVGTALLHLDAQDDLSAWPAQRPDSAAVGLMPRHLAYVIYTSGSTGQPKGVMVEHRQLLNLVGWHTARFPLRSGERTASAAGLGFDACAWELWPALCQGATVVLAPAAAAGDPLQLLDWWAGERLHDGFLVTALAETALQRGRLPQGLRTLRIGGERQARPAPRDAGFELVNNYGPTEATVVASSGTSRPDDAVLHIGRPIANTRIHLLDAHGHRVPPGVAGEIHIAGAQVARGYLNRPGLTRERFVPDPFSTEPGARMYRSGDLARWSVDAQGHANLEFLGRLDAQVKLRGMRIEPGEIEAQLRRLDGVREAAVVLREDVAGDPRLVAYVATGAAIDAEALRRQLAAVLPQAMLPSAFVALPALPLTANGKLDVRALPAPGDAALAQRPHEAPQGEMECAIAAAWAELLHLQRVGRDDDFFALGGHSLATIALIERLRQQGIVLEVRSLFDTPVLKDLAARAQRSGPQALPESLVPLRRGGTQRPVFFVHEPTGEVLGYERLARHLGEDVPAWGLRASRADADGPVALETLARRYLAALRSVQPQGPYRLAGWSGGGLIAYEMAHQLLGEDEAVEFLGLIDSGRPGHKPAEAIPDEAQMRWVFLEIHVAYLDPSIALARVRALQSQMSLDEAVGHCRGLGWLPPSFTVEELAWRAARFTHLVRACFAYEAPPLPIPVHLYTGEPEPGSDASLGWEAVAGRHLRLIAVGGDHKTLMEEPHIRALASQIGQALQASSAAPAPAPREPAALPLQTGRRGAAGIGPVHCIPGAGANVTCFLPLVQALGPAVPVTGLQGRGHDGESVPHASVQAAARAWLPALRALQPQGPYRLLGHSFGGWIAYELACLLEQAGEAVAPLVLVDCEPPGPLRPVDRLRTLQLFVALVEMDRGQPLPLDLPALQALDDTRRIERLLGVLTGAGVLPPRTPAAKLRGLLRVFERHLNTGYEPTARFGGRVLLVQAERPEHVELPERPLLSNEQKHAAWARHADALELHRFAGSNHLSVLKAPHAARLAALLAQAWAWPGDAGGPGRHPLSTHPSTEAQ